MKNIFFKEKPVLALIVIERRGGNIYATEVAKEIDTTYAHAVKIISRMKDLGLVKSERKGRKKVLDVTEEGKELAEVFGKIIESKDNSANFHLKYNMKEANLA